MVHFIINDYNMRNSIDDWLHFTRETTTPLNAYAIEIKLIENKLILEKFFTQDFKFYRPLDYFQHLLNTKNVYAFYNIILELFDSIPFTKWTFSMKYAILNKQSGGLIDIILQTPSDKKLSLIQFIIKNSSDKAYDIFESEILLLRSEIMNNCYKACIQPSKRIWFHTNG